MTKISAIKAFSDNYIWCLDDAKSAVVVDPGEATPVLDHLQQGRLTLTAIMVTHHHPDHVGGIARLKQQYPKAVVFGPAQSPCADITAPLNDGDDVNILGHPMKVLAVPGHTLDHIAYFTDAGDERWLFCGDTLFAGGCGRVFEGTPAMMYQSLQYLASLPADTKIFCAHEYTMANLAFAIAVDPGNQALQQRIKTDQAKREQNLPTVPSSLSVELATNPFLRCDQPALVEAAYHHTQRRIQDENDSSTEVFAALRDWKNHF